MIHQEMPSGEAAPQESSAIIQPGDIVLLAAEDQKSRTVIKLQPGGQWHTHRGTIRHDDLIGQPWGRMVSTQLGHAFLVLEPSTYDLVRHVKRTTQIIFPKDAAYIVLRLNLFPGRRVIEAGTGSGALTLALARAVMPTGRVYSYEQHQRIGDLAARNLERLNLLDYVELKIQDISAGFDEKNVDACFLDLREPWHFLPAIHASLKEGGFFGSLLPTTNQVCDLLAALPDHGFLNAEVEELLLRSYKPVPGRLRPADRMIAHTGYLLFARKVTLPEGEAWRTVDSKRYRPRAAGGRAADVDWEDEESSDENHSQEGAASDEDLLGA